jgi:hypothetical protein
MSRKAKRKRGLRVPMVEAAKDVPWFEVQGHEKVGPGKAPRFSGALHKPIIQSSTGDMDGVMASIISQRVEKLILLLLNTTTLGIPTIPGCCSAFGLLVLSCQVYKFCERHLEVVVAREGGPIKLVRI